MCGINGVIGSIELVQGMNAATLHRGPDQQGAVQLGALAVGMNRLSIVDLSEAGRQPMTTEDGRFTIVFNGEIYNHHALRAELVREGVQFRGRSDTETILQAFAVWGASIVERLEGMWAFAIHDREQGTLFLSRDPFGIKPLYLWHAGMQFAFSSEIRGLLASTVVPRVINEDAVRDVLLVGYPLAPRTILQAVEAFLPGEERVITIATGESTRQIRTLQTETGIPPSDEELEVLLHKSVEAHLEADVPVAVLFSGGIDSTLLSLFAAKSRPDVPVYHLAIEGRPDTTFARKIAAYAKLNLIETPFLPEQVTSWLPDYWAALDQPFVDTSFLPVLALSARVAKDVKVVLSGEGGDELFGGYARHSRLGNFGAGLSLFPNTPTWQKLLSSLARYPSFTKIRPKLQALARRFAYASSDVIGLFLAETGFGALLGDDHAARRVIVDRLNGREHPDGGLALDRLVYLPDDLLMKLDVAAMARSLEGRVPFLDRSLFARVGAASTAWKRPSGVGKAPLRRLLERHLPPELLDRPKSGFSLPLMSYLLPLCAPEETRSWYRSRFPGVVPGLDRGQVDGYPLFAMVVLRQYLERHNL